MIDTIQLRQHHNERGSDPSPEEIRERCREVRQEWTESTRRRRAGENPGPWTIPEAADPHFDRFSQRSKT